MIASPTSMLVLYNGSGRGRSTLDVARRLIARYGASLTVATVAVTEDEHQGCCDLRSGMWNRMQREDADAQLREARATLADVAGVKFVAVEGKRVDDSLDRLADVGGHDLVIAARARRLKRSRRAAGPQFVSPSQAEALLNA